MQRMNVAETKHVVHQRTLSEGGSQNSERPIGLQMYNDIALYCLSACRSAWLLSWYKSWLVGLLGNLTGWLWLMTMIVSGSEPWYHLFFVIYPFWRFHSGVASFICYLDILTAPKFEHSSGFLVKWITLLLGRFDLCDTNCGYIHDFSHDQNKWDLKPSFGA